MEDEICERCGSEKECGKTPKECFRIQIEEPEFKEWISDILKVLHDQLESEKPN